MTSHDPRLRPPAAPPAPALHGILAEYATPQALLTAASRVREAGFKRWDTFTPFPVHGIDGAMGIKPTVLPWLVFGAGLTGCAVAVLLQYWTNAVDYPWIVSGKPFWSIPANIPIIFELTVLFSALTALVGMLMLNNLPQLSHPLDLVARFARATDDRFFLLIEAADPKFDAMRTRALLDETAPVVIETVRDERTTPAALPRGLVYALILAGAAALIPFALVAQARVTKAREPRIHLVQDMDFQAKVKTQKAFPFFADGRGSRPAVEGTVALEQSLDEHLTLGKVNGLPARTFPAAIPADAASITVGRRGYETYCAPCHGMAGNGDGMVAQRAEALAQGTWVPPTNLNQDYLRQQPIGELFASVSNGVRNMPAYGHLVTVEDRWRILMYVRALQRRSTAAIDDVPPAQRRALE